jgi:peptidoglycan/LPS O-acetylase OafA/YrhL
MRGWSAFVVVLVGYWAASQFPDLSPAGYLVAATGVVLTRSVPPIPERLARALVYLGDLSYPLYLVHVPLLAWSQKWVHCGNPLVWIGASLAAAAALYHAVDAPLRARFTPRPVPLYRSSSP